MWVQLEWFEGVCTVFEGKQSSKETDSGHYGGSQLTRTRENSSESFKAAAWTEGSSSSYRLV